MIFSAPETNGNSVRPLVGGSPGTFFCPLKPSQMAPEQQADTIQVRTLH